MKIPMPCMLCDPSQGIVGFVAPRDDGRYELTCPSGHVTTVILQQQKFELLFEMGAFAIRDGYFREAVNSFSASLERFYEFFVKASWFEQSGLEPEDIERGWGTIGQQSERQLGAFVATYFGDFGRPPVLLSQRNREFRNEVVHKGRIPSMKEAVVYGQAVLDIVRPQLREARARYPVGVDEKLWYHLMTTRTENDRDRVVATLGMPTIINLHADEEHDARTLEAVLGGFAASPGTPADG